MSHQKRRNSESSSSKLARLKQERVENLDELKNVEDVNTNSSLLDVINEKPQEHRVIFVLDNAPLHKGLVGKKWKILDSWRDQQFLLKHKKNLKDFCPENVRQPLLDIFDSRVNKAGKVGAVYVKIDDGVLFEIKPHARIPRTYNRFCGLILDLLKKRCIRAEDTNEVLFRVLNEPLSQHLPRNSRIIGVSNGLEKWLTWRTMFLLLVMIRISFLWLVRRIIRKLIHVRMT
ncbi:ribosomal RNA small subunit methyltransferase nep-1-like [Benincasa hispida]|uniref:ribosomal RNA small subunit methyltransferase nep-1-like n=1 Tax=Benincasa hispida TaxID=102211 RepID=UPI0019028616|nr:ribosomal RNA small subunit methyltransferase nep-1-like [Benincasa hispida]